MSYPITGLSTEQLAAIARIPNAGSSEHTFEPASSMILTNAWQVVTDNWVEHEPPEGVTLDNATGVYSLSKTGRWKPTLERIYHQHDRAPATPIMIYIKIQVSTDNINWTDTDFNRSSIISAATATDEPAVQSFTTDLFVDVTSLPSYFRLLVKADEGGATPDQTELILMKITSNIISNVPV